MNNVYYTTRKDFVSFAIKKIVNYFVVNIIAIIYKVHVSNVNQLTNYNVNRYLL